MNLEDVRNHFNKSDKVKLFLHENIYDIFVENSKDMKRWNKVRKNDVLLRDDLYEYELYNSKDENLDLLLHHRIPVIAYIRRHKDSETHERPKVFQFIIFQYNDDGEVTFIDHPVPYTEYELQQINVLKILESV